MTVATRGSRLTFKVKIAHGPDGEPIHFYGIRGIRCRDAQEKFVEFQHIDPKVVGRIHRYDFHRIEQVQILRSHVGCGIRRITIQHAVPDKQGVGVRRCIVQQTFYRRTGR